MSEATSWEYRVLTLGAVFRGPKDEDIEATLNELGSEGWELVAATQREGTNKITLIAKRPLSAAARRRRTYPEGMR